MCAKFRRVRGENDVKAPWDEVSEDVKNAYNKALGEAKFRLDPEILGCCNLWLRISYKNEFYKKLKQLRLTRVSYRTRVEGYRVSLDTPVLRGLFPATQKAFEDFSEMLEHLTKVFNGEIDDLPAKKALGDWAPKDAEAGSRFRFIKIMDLGPCGAVSPDAVPVAVDKFFNGDRSCRGQLYTGRIEEGEIISSSVILSGIVPGGLGFKIEPQFYRVQDEHGKIFWTWTASTAHGILGKKVSANKLKMFAGMIGFLRNPEAAGAFVSLVDAVIEAGVKKGKKDSSESGQSKTGENTDGVGGIPTAQSHEIREAEGKVGNDNDLAADD